jgi:hypothetical protein
MKMKHKIMNRFCIPALCCIALAFVPARGYAQILSRGDLFGPGAPPPMVGIEIGVGQHSEMGTADCDCGAQFTGGNGTGLIGSLLFELPLDYAWAIGIKGGIDFKNFTTTNNQYDQVILPIPNTSILDTTSVPVNRVADIKTTYLDFAPYLQY